MKSVCITMAIFFIAQACPLYGEEPPANKPSASKTAESQEVLAIARKKIEAAEFDRALMEELWMKVNFMAMRTQIDERYGGLNLNENQKNLMASADVVGYRGALKPAVFEAELQQLFVQYKAAAWHDIEAEQPSNSTEPPPRKPDSGSPTPVPEDKKDSIENRLYHWVVGRLEANWAGMANEDNFATKGVRLITGISAKDIEKYGPLGGDNSFARRILPDFSKGGGVLGGPNGFVRKNLGIP